MFFDIVQADLGINVVRKCKFGWLINQVLPSDSLLWKIFMALQGNSENMKSKKPRRLSPDGYLPDFNCILEFDELQHFTAFRSITLKHYPVDTPLGFDIKSYQSWCKKYAETALKKGASGYRRPKPEFPFNNGRAAQRALFDAFRDLLAPRHGLQATIRVSEFEVPSLLHDRDTAAVEIRDALGKYL